MAHAGEYAPPEVSFWVRYLGSCEETDPENADVVIRQSFGNSDDDRVIRIGDTTTKFMSDLGSTLAGSTQTTRVGMTRPGDNQTARLVYNLGSAYASIQPQMLSSGEARNVAMNMWHRNCFTLASSEFLTEQEWLARTDYRIVFQSSSFVATTETIEQFGVHIFTSQVPFQELDLIPNQYSPALHCIPNRTVGGFVFDPTDASQYFILYDYKDYYPDQIGLVVQSGEWGSDFELSNSCDTISADDDATWLTRTYLAYRTLAPNLPGSLVPFQADGRLTCPNQSWDAPVPDWEQVFEDDSGTACDDEPVPPGPNCGSSEYCHGSQDVGINVAYGAMGNEEVLSYSQRTIEANHPVRNRLFVQGIFKSVLSSDSELAFSYMLSDVGSDNFELSNYFTFTGTAAQRIDTSSTTFGGLDFGRGFPSGVDLDPNPPSSWSDQDTNPQAQYFSENTNIEFGPPWFCDCDEATSEVLNFGRQDDLNTSLQIYRNGNWVSPMPGWVLAGNPIQTQGLNLSYDADYRGTDRVIGQPQLNFP